MGIRTPAAIVLACLAGGAVAMAQLPAAESGGQRQPAAREKRPEAIDIVRQHQVISRVSIAAIGKAATGEISRYGQRFAATPFEVVLQLANISRGTRIRVAGEEDEMFLQAGGGGEDPAGYVVIFNMRGFAVLTPVPAAQPGSGPSRGTPALPAPGTGGGTAQKSALPPPGSGGGQGGAAQKPQPADPSSPPAGTGRGAGSGGATGAGLGKPAGFAPLKEVRSFTRIEILEWSRIQTQSC